jgi:Tfp pilus assembly protein PilV
MDAHVKHRGRKGEAGFSMIELLIAAFVMAIGILGLTMLQTYALVSGGGSQNQTVAIQVAEQVMEQAENVGRNSIYCAHNGFTVPTPTLNFWAGTVTQTFSNTGVLNGTPTMFTATATPTTAGTGLVTPVSQIGGVCLLQVVVTWSEALNSTGGKIQRSVTLNRRIQYATK